MSDDETLTPPESVSTDKPRVPRWKKVLLTVAGFLLVVGLGLKGAGALGSGDAPDTGRPSSPDTSRLDSPNPLLDGRVDLVHRPQGDDMLPGEHRDIPRQDPYGGGGGIGGAEAGGAAGGAEGSGISEYSPAFFKGGLSFFVAFCVGLAARTFLKMSALFLGLVALAVFGLSYMDLVQVDWPAIQGHFDDLASRVGHQVKDFKGFVNGSLPSAGMASLGLFTGFKKN